MAAAAEALSETEPVRRLSFAAIAAFAVKDFDRKDRKEIPQRPQRNPGQGITFYGTDAYVCWARTRRMRCCPSCPRRPGRHAGRRLLRRNGLAGTVSGSAEASRDHAGGKALRTDCALHEPTQPLPASNRLIAGCIIAECSRMLRRDHLAGGGASGEEKHNCEQASWVWCHRYWVPARARRLST